MDRADVFSIKSTLSRLLLGLEPMSWWLRVGPLGLDPARK